VDVGANHPFDLSITASLYEQGWRGLLVEADPDFAGQLRRFRPEDQVVEVAASDRGGVVTFHRVLGTGLGTLSGSEAQAAEVAGFAVEEFRVPTKPLNQILEEYFANRTDSDIHYVSSHIHFMSIDVEGAEPLVLAGLDLNRFRPWVMCIEAIDAETKEPNHENWQSHLIDSNYRDVAFDGINRWYVAQEHAELFNDIATPLNPIDAGRYGWMSSDNASAADLANKSYNRVAWQRALLLNQASEIEAAQTKDQQLAALTQQLNAVSTSRANRIAQPIDRVLHKVKSTLISASGKLPAPLYRWTIRKRHLRIVEPAMQVYTDPAFLGSPSAFTPSWANPELKPPVPTAGLELGPLSQEQVTEIESWLAGGPFDTDAQLEIRTDGMNDELGRTLAALRNRLRINANSKFSDSVSGGRILFDARSLQTPTFGARGIGRFAHAALASVRASAADQDIVLLVDPGLNQLPSELVGQCEQVAAVSLARVSEFALVVQPSPMTADPRPLIELLQRDIAKIAIVFDFIPMHFPSVYLRHVAPRAEYAAALDSLATYNDFLCISEVTKGELVQFLTGRGIPAQSFSAAVAWPEAITPGDGATSGRAAGPIVVMTGDEARKNTFGALAAIGVATSSDSSRDVQVVGMAHRKDHVHHLSIAAAIRPGEARALPHLSPSDMAQLLASASVIVVPSFDEGLSLPILEAVAAGTPIVASDIPAHRELIGRGSYLADPQDLPAFATAINRHRGSGTSAAKQRRTLLGHKHVSLEEVIAKKVKTIPAGTPAVVAEGPRVVTADRRLNIGFATPWSPQRSGVADFSTIIGIELAKIADVTVYTTADANPLESLPSGVDIQVRPVDELFANNGAHNHDVLVSVVGNSHFHLPFVQLTAITPCVVVAHDTRMNEFYMALRGVGGLQELMLRTDDPHAPRNIDPSLDDQIADMRLLQNAALWELVRHAQQFVFHSPSAKDRITRETGIEPTVITFPNYRDPELHSIGSVDRVAAKGRLGFDPERIHLTSLGFIDMRTKMSGVVVEAASWLQQWGYPVSLHFAGAASPEEEAQLLAQAEYAGLRDFEITGFLTDQQFRDYLLATDIGVQLRISSLLGVSGPLGDLAGYGVTSVASSGLVRDVDAPEFVFPIPEYVSPVMVAQQIEQCIQQVIPDSDRERMRIEYLRGHSPAQYAQEFLRVLQEVHQS
jgi:FkbM family methyltransferase